MDSTEPVSGLPASQAVGWPADSGGPSRRIRVVHIIEQLGVGGAEKQLLGLLTRMDASRFDQQVCYFRQKTDSLDGQFRAAGIPTMFIDKDGLSAMRFFRQLRKTLREKRPQIVHTWLYVANFWGRWAALLARVPRIVTSDRAEIERTTPLVKLYERLLAPRTVRLANSQAVAESLHHHYGIPVERIRIIYNAVGLPECDRDQARAQIRAELSLPVDQKIVLMLGRQSPEKNYPMYLRAGQMVCRRRNDVTFLAVGRQDYKEEIGRVLAGLDMGDRIRWIDGRADVHRWLAAADVFCFTSNHEGFPNAVLEAMHAGLPVVCAAFASAREVLEDGLSGTIVPLNDEQALAREVNALLDDPGRRRHQGEQACQRARQAFSWDVLTLSMERLYHELCGAGRLGRMIR